jgi:hypothetical protein
MKTHRLIIIDDHELLRRGFIAHCLLLIRKSALSPGTTLRTQSAVHYSFAYLPPRRWIATPLARLAMTTSPDDSPAFPP